MFWDGVLCIGGNASPSDETAQIVAVGSILLLTLLIGQIYS